jgi:hypothetical protein
MNRITTKPDAAPPPAPPASAEESPLPPQERGLGWSLALGTWVVAFVVLVLYEAWNFVFPLVKAMFR